MTFDLPRAWLVCMLDAQNKRWGCMCTELHDGVLRNFWRDFNNSVALSTKYEAVQGVSVVSSAWG